MPVLQIKYLSYIATYCGVCHGITSEPGNRSQLAPAASKQKQLTRYALSFHDLPFSEISLFDDG
jgi:hypothetical protein